MSFAPLRTQRLVIRMPEAGDLDAIFERRSLPEVARYQDWETPYQREWAVESLRLGMLLDGPTNGKGLNLTVVLAERPQTIVGDVYVELRWEGRVGYVGFTLHPDYWGRGYATEATEALIHYLFTDVGVSRIESSLHPDNVPSARVLEACGLVFEGLTTQSFWVGDECSDDMFYGMTRAGWEAWCARPRHRPDVVELAPITPDNRGVVGRLTTHKSQERFVSPMAGSFRDALFPDTVDGAPVVPWYRAITADGEVVGFIMAAEMTTAHENPYLWRLLVDRMHQRRGIGAMALELFEQRCRDQGATAIEVSWFPGPGSPEPMYLARGYQPSGKIEDGEVHAVKTLT
jgi:RimJ/RimL family protein N-acetyltransferase